MKKIYRKALVVVLMIIGSCVFAEKVNYKTVFDYKAETGRVYYLDQDEKLDVYNFMKTATKLMVRFENCNTIYKAEIMRFEKFTDVLEKEYSYGDVMCDWFEFWSYGELQDKLLECWRSGMFSKETDKYILRLPIDDSQFIMLGVKHLIDEHILEYLGEYNYVYVWDEDWRCYFNIFHTTKGYGFYAVAYEDMQPWNYNSKNWIVDMRSRQTEVNNKLEVEQ